MINLALSSSLRGPRGSGMFGMGKKLRSAATVQGALWGSARAAAVPRAGCRALMAPRRAHQLSFVAISSLLADKSVFGQDPRPPTPTQAVLSP